MKKLRLKALSLGAKEILNREQLKSIFGGDGSGSTGGSSTYAWTCGCVSKVNPIYYTYNYGCTSPTDPTCIALETANCDYSYSYAQPVCYNIPYVCQASTYVSCLN